LLLDGRFGESAGGVSEDSEVLGHQWKPGYNQSTVSKIQKTWGN